MLLTGWRSREVRVNVSTSCERVDFSEAKTLLDKCRNTESKCALLVGSIV